MHRMTKAKRRYSDVYKLNAKGSMIEIKKYIFYVNKL